MSFKEVLKPIAPWVARRLFKLPLEQMLVAIPLLSGDHEGRAERRAPIYRALAIDWIANDLRVGAIF